MSVWGYVDLFFFGIVVVIIIIVMVLVLYELVVFLEYY